MEPLLIDSLRILWNYMHLNQSLQKCDLIIGCGCSDMEVPVKCATLKKEGYAPKILFCGGLGKRTKHYLNQTEAEVFKEIAMKEGVSEEDILIETKSTNTQDNFKFARKIIEEQNIPFNRILIVHGPFSERRTLAAAETIFPDKELFITSPNVTFHSFLELLGNNPKEAFDIISVIVGDIQRMVIYPQFGWQTEQPIPNEVYQAYNDLKKLGFTKFIWTPEKIEALIDQFGIEKGKTKTLFY